MLDLFILKMMTENVKQELGRLPKSSWEEHCGEKGRILKGRERGRVKAVNFSS